MRWRPAAAAAAAAARLPGIVIVRFACGVPSQVADKVLHIMHEVDEAHDHSHLSAPKSNRVP
jgi:predicted nucleotide-binding protein (sugar kinase/HSP70/actin superfamily)